MISRLGIVGPLAALGAVLTLAPASAAADEGAYYRLLCDWSESSRASAGVTTPALPTGECATPAVSKAPPGLTDPDGSSERAERPDRDGDPFGRPAGDPTIPPDALDPRSEPVRDADPDPNSDPASDPTSRPNTASIDPDRELRNRFDVPAPDVAAGPGILGGPIPELPEVDRTSCDVPGSGCGGGQPGVTESPPVDLPPSIPGVVEPPPSGCAGVPGCP